MNGRPKGEHGNLIKLMHYRQKTRFGRVRWGGGGGDSPESRNKNNRTLQVPLKPIISSKEETAGEVGVGELVPNARWIGVRGS